MNLRVDLIMSSEQRSGSVLSLKSVLHIAYIVVPVALGIFISVLFVNTQRLASELDVLESQWASTEPKKEAALGHSQAVTHNLQVMAEAEGWRQARLAWYPQLHQLQQEVPEGVQLNLLKIENTVLLTKEEGVPESLFTLVLRGKGVGTDAERDIEVFQGRLLATPVLSSLIEDVAVPEYGADLSPGAGRNDRIFRMDCTYRARKYQAEIPE